MISVSQITTQIYLGSTPYNRDDIDYLVSNFSINSVLSLQSDFDLKRRKIPIQELEAYYRQLGISFSRYGIRDFSVEDMAKKLYAPTQELNRQIELGKTVFVHCNSGICRAPSTVLAFLCRYSGHSLKEGLALIRQKRPIVNPYVDAVMKTLEQLAKTD